MGYYISVLGLNHKTAPLELRESASFTPSKRQDFLKKMKFLYPLHEFVVLSTCNRVEVYSGSLAEELDIDRVLSYFASYHNRSPADIYPFIYIYKNEEAVNHLFEVASGLDSLVIGEAQILEQVKKAYIEALESGSTGRTLNQLFQKALTVGKKVRSLTRIGEGNVSASSIACQLAEKILGGLSDKKILLVGTGKVGILTLKSLKEKGANTVLVSSRTYQKAKALAEEFNGKAIRFEELKSSIIDADVLISATSAPCYIIHPDMIRIVMAREDRKRGILLMVDLACPRDIDPRISEIPGVCLYNIDDLQDIAKQNIKKREKEIFRCREIIAKEKTLFMQRIGRHNPCPSRALDLDKVLTPV